MKVTLGKSSDPNQDAIEAAYDDGSALGDGVTDSDEAQPDWPKDTEAQKEAGPFAEIPDLCSRIDTLIYDIEATPISQDKAKILGKLIGAMELLQGNLK